MSDASARRRPDRNPWTLEPHCVFGGYRIAYIRWTQPRGEDWDQECEFAAWDRTVYATHEEALAAIVAHAASQMGERHGSGYG